MSNTMTVAELLRKTREFYTKRRKGWTIHALRKENGKASYCVLGAMTAVATGNDKFKFVDNNTPPRGIPNRDVMVKAAKAITTANKLKRRGIWRSVYYFNDRATRAKMLRALRKAEAYAREKGI